MDFEPRINTDPYDSAHVYTVGTYRLTLKYLRAQFRTLTPSQEGTLDKIESKGLSFRVTRGDGDCYYRSVYVLYLEELIRKNLLGKFILKLSQGNKHYKVSNEQHGKDR
jgi:hypothetical protein